LISELNNFSRLFLVLFDPFVGFRSARFCGWFFEPGVADFVIDIFSTRVGINVAS